MYNLESNNRDIVELLSVGYQNVFRENWCSLRAAMAPNTQKQHCLLPNNYLGLMFTSVLEVFSLIVLSFFCPTSPLFEKSPSKSDSCLHGSTGQLFDRRFSIVSRKLFR